MQITASRTGKQRIFVQIYFRKVLHYNSNRCIIFINNGRKPYYYAKPMHKRSSRKEQNRMIKVFIDGKSGKTGLRI